MQIKYSSEWTEVGLFYNASEPTRGREDIAMGGGVVPLLFQISGSWNKTLEWVTISVLS